MVVWGLDAGLHLEADRMPATRYVNVFPVVAIKYWTAERTAALLKEWQESPPGIIVEGLSTQSLLRPPAEGAEFGRPGCNHAASRLPALQLSAGRFLWGRRAL